MIGATLGDMIGAPYEFDRSPKTKKFPLFGSGSKFTDDSVMTFAVAEGLMESIGQSDDAVKAALVASMRKWGKRYPDAGYGGMFRQWLKMDHPEPYGSYGNGSAMRVSSVGWLFDTLEEVRHMARLTAEVTHNHPEGIKGAEAVASAIYLARSGKSKDEIRDYIIREFGYDLSRSCDEIRPTYHHNETCQKTVPEAVTAFLEGSDFEDVIRTAVSLGGDCDTLTCIAGGIAEAFYGVPEELAQECRKRLPENMCVFLDCFYEAISSKDDHDSFLDGNERIEEAINQFYTDSTKENLTKILESIRDRMHADGHFIFPIRRNEKDGRQFSYCTLKTGDGLEWPVAFTSEAEFKKGQPSETISDFIDSTLRRFQHLNAPGFLINPWSKAFKLSKKLIGMIFEADGSVEYTVSDDPVSAELLEDGSYLKRVIGICRRNETQLNGIKALRILRDSSVWIPCQAVVSEADQNAILKMIKDAEQSGGLESLVGKTIVHHDVTRMIPDILQSGEDLYFPAFTSEDEMGEYGEHFSKVQRPFLEAIHLARNNEKNVRGIVINAFTEPFVVPRNLFDLILLMPSGIEKEETEDE